MQPDSQTIFSDRADMNYHNKRICLWDRICELADEILVFILSLLKLKEAARTSILSSRWRYLWTFFIGKMLFYEDEWRISWPQLVTQINQAMTLHRGVSIKGFTIAFNNVNSVEDIDHWIEFVAKKRATKFELILGSQKISYSPNTFTRIRLHPPSINWNFESLKVVWLLKVNLTGGAAGNAAMNNLLLNSPNLEHLYLRYLEGLLKLLVPSSCFRLKELSLVRCHGLRKLEIFARSVEVFHCIGLDREKQQRPFDHVKQFGLPKLDHLHLIIAPPEDSDEMLSWMYLVEAAPALHTLEIVFPWKHGFIRGLTIFSIHGCS
ncbi:hypothetical protein CDL12_11752 [Handroanthus impetiginosus]|uniref:F-box domain-containing protein n=1 Tax=Handroanthus impetiginosus TaxID=429701 RepID=A0A2G9HDN7_9LAMI|nr:hypothetical protein CDL12_11752 [Handroanthus impetiginosus]